MVDMIRMRGEISATLEIQDQPEEAMIRAFDAETRPGWDTTVAGEENAAA